MSELKNCFVEIKPNSYISLDGTWYVCLIHKAGESDLYQIAHSHVHCPACPSELQPIRIDMTPEQFIMKIGGEIIR